MECAFTASVLQALLATPVATIAAIVLPATKTVLGDATSLWASLHSSLETVPIIELPRRRELISPQFLAMLATLNVDVIVVACFPWRLPSAVRALPRQASVNVHPSLLPDGRGPAPIFWAFRRALNTTGVTLHFLDDGLDTGPIIDQRAVAIPSVATMITLERTLARIGTEMLDEFLRAPFNSITPWPQPTDEALPALFPTAQDLIVTTAWPATSAARFINAVSPVYGSIEVVALANGQRIAVLEALRIEERASDASAVQLQGDGAWIRFPDGVLHCRLRPVRHRLAFEI